MIYISMIDPETNLPLCFEIYDLWIDRTEHRDNEKDEALPDSEREVTSVTYDLVARAMINGTTIPSVLFSSESEEQAKLFYESILVAVDKGARVVKIPEVSQ